MCTLSILAYALLFFVDRKRVLRIGITVQNIEHRVASSARPNRLVNVWVIYISRRKSMNKKLLTVAVGAALYAVGPSAFALETTLSGQVNRALMWADNGTRSETHHVDNAISSTRFRFNGTDDLS